MSENDFFLSSTAELGEGRNKLSEILEASGFDPRTRSLLILACDEALSALVENEIENGKLSSREIRVKVDCNPSRVRITVEDSVKDFEASHLSYEEMYAMAQGRRSHRMGVFLIRQIMDEVSYRYKKGFQNEIEMIKFTPA